MVFEGQGAYQHPGAYTPVVPPSTWPLRLAGILIMLFAAQGMVDALSSYYFSPGSDTFVTFPEPEPLGPYPENGSARQQSEWNVTHEEWVAWNLTQNITVAFEESGLLDIQLAWQGGFLLLAMVSGLLLVTLNRVGYWVGFGALAVIEVGTLHVSWVTGQVMADILSEIPESQELPAFLTNPLLIGGFTAVTASMCNVACLAVLIVTMVATRPPAVAPVGYALPAGTGAGGLMSGQPALVQQVPGQVAGQGPQTGMQPAAPVSGQVPGQVPQTGMQPAAPMPVPAQAGQQVTPPLAPESGAATGRPGWPPSP